MMAEWQDRRTSSHAANLLTAVTQGEFLVDVAVAQRLSAVLRPLDTALQKREWTWCAACTEDYYRVNDFVPAVEAVVTNIKNRFGTHTRRQHSC